ncbi:MAG: sigma-70 region 4 domain-containing protein, partial [Muribaculaceae bacterium]|nr:sigma-70 region 4 domain-containing protein [Muribaculaceae bacterium]
DLPDDADDADRSDVLKEVETIVDSELTDQQREILRLREIEGLSNEMIAARLDMNEVTVRVNLSRARKKIRDMYNNKQPR